MNPAGRAEDVSLPPEVAERIDRLCDQFEAVWKAGRRPKLEEYLGSTEAHERQALLRELVALELGYRLKRGEKPQLDEYALRFAEHLSVIRRVFADVATPSGQAELHENRQIIICCPAGHRLKVKASHVGRKVRCPICRRTVEVTEPETHRSYQEVVETRQEEKPRSGPAPIENPGRYELLEKVGEGGYGAVYKAWDPQLQRVVAVKVPRFDVPRDKLPNAIERFLREARAAARVRHPNVCPIYDVGQQGDTPYAVMAYIDGPPLSQAMKGRRFTVAEAVTVVRKVAVALQAVHARGIVHRDLKPGNVLVDPNGEPMLTDFGLARPLEESQNLTQPGTAVGTPAYMSPEQAAGQLDQVGPWTDVYSLGVVLYQFLTGRLPFEGPAHTILHKIIHESAPLPSTLRPDLNPALENIILKAMAREPGSRYKSAQAFADALGTLDLPRRPSVAHFPELATTADLPAQAEGRCMATPVPSRGGESAGTPTQGRQRTPYGPSVRKLIARRWKIISLGTAALLVLGGFLLALQIKVRVKDKEGRVSAELTVPEGAEVEVEQGGKIAVTVRTPAEPRVSAPSRQPNDVTTSQPRRRKPTPIVIPHEPLPKLPAGTPLSPLALVTNPAPIKGVRSWTIETREQRGWVDAVGYSPDGRLLAAGGEDGMIRLWDTSTRQLLRVLVGHGGLVQALAWSPDSRVLATGAKDPDTSVRLWEAGSGRALATLHGHAYGIQDLAWFYGWLPAAWTRPCGYGMVTPGNCFRLCRGIQMRFGVWPGRQTATLWRAECNKQRGCLVRSQDRKSEMIVAFAFGTPAASCSVPRGRAGTVMPLLGALVVTF
ncbi:MAG: protein kinase [Planctomycetes bacterium]|nr:protein kinase [Planctomycetota bacterium]